MAGGADNTQITPSCSPGPPYVDSPPRAFFPMIDREDKNPILLGHFFCLHHIQSVISRLETSWYRDFFLLFLESQKCWSKTKVSVSASKVLISRNFWSRKKVSVSVSKVLVSSLNGDKTLLSYSTFVILVERSKSVMLLPF